ncbi:hypothetical protein [Burkholderia mallei]|nr:hypothetical protein [Burkholderia mallei]ABM52536.1 hypothetical protein BMASAVP1_A1482 [Burkholderia mallei SAVP1]EES43651.1 conserved hypothetical protein [Burkholderia mallei PRL-20]KYW98152.1 chorismate synthase [Burkholderia mallei]RJE66213.1 chorismate synthase [Burkholderia mallei]RPA04325.1 chorismate synthase [Burkholderia mallei]
MSVIGRRAEGVARHSRRRPARDAGIETASKRHQNGIKTKTGAE